MRGCTRVLGPPRGGVGEWVMRFRAISDSGINPVCRGSESFRSPVQENGPAKPLGASTWVKRSAEWMLHQRELGNWISVSRPL